MTSVKLFSNKTRDYTGPAENTESRYKYLNRSARPYFEDIRNTIQSWFDEFLIDDKENFKSKFQGAEFESRFFELYLYKLLTNLGYKVTPEPKLIDGSDKNPDFLVENDDGEKFILEATVRTEGAPEHRENSKIKDMVLDTLNSLALKGFLFGVRFNGWSKLSHRSQELKKAITDFKGNVVNELASISHDEIVEKSTKSQPFVSFVEAEISGLEVFIDLLPKPSADEVAETPVGCVMGGVHWSNTDGELIKSLKQKSTKYKEIGLPYVVAINYVGFPIDDEDMFSTAFGRPQLTFPTMEEGRTLNGAFLHNGKPQNTTVSAILFGNNILPSTRTESNLFLMHNPYARNPYAGNLEKLTTFKNSETEVNKIEGLHQNGIMLLKGIDEFE